MDTRWSGEAKYQTLLAMAQAANSQRDLSSVLQAVADALEGLVPVDGLMRLHLRRRQGPESRDLPPRRSAALGREPAGVPPTVLGSNRLPRTARTRPGCATPSSGIGGRWSFDTSGTTQGWKGPRGSSPDAECGVVVPLTMGEAFVAGLAFGRMTPSPFSPDEVQILEDMVRPVTTAVANALAFEEIQKLHSLLEDENLALREEITAAAAAGGIIGASAGLREVLERVGRVAATDSTVLITGETGTGKELIARAIHAGSPRARRALVKVNCAALPEGLIASELFGHERGAFTGALERRRGRFELAAGSTIFLDEVGELPAPVQVALLRVLQEREFERVGGHETLRTDARVVAATNRNLEEAVREGRFRSDLFFRLNVFPIQVPPLRERAEDIPLLAEYWASQYARKVGKAVRGIDEAAMTVLCAYPWPGNIRELQNAVERAVILARGSVLELSDFELPSLAAEPEGPRPPRAGPADERQQIEQALKASRGRVYGDGGAAEALGVPPSTLESRIRRLGIDKHGFRRRGSAPPAVKP